MSSEKNFRVNINLCLWFNDHRRRTRIFINDDIQTIRDLENRIEKIFKIKHFHLTSDDQYLPPTEDIRVLQKDDIIWVAQKSYEKENVHETPPEIQTEGENVIKIKKKPTSTSEGCLLQEHLPKKKKKKKQHENSYQPSDMEEIKKKRKRKADDDSVEYQLDLPIAEEPAVQKEKTKKKKSINTAFDSTVSGQSSLPALQSHVNCYNEAVANKANKMEETTFSSSSTSVEKHLQTESDSRIEEGYECKGALSNYKKKLSVPTITDKYLKEKKINIVKIEYLSGKEELGNKNSTLGFESNRNATSHNLEITDNDVGQNSTEQEHVICNTLKINNIDQRTSMFPTHIETENRKFDTKENDKTIGQNTTKIYSSPLEIPSVEGSYTKKNFSEVFNKVDLTVSNSNEILNTKLPMEKDDLLNQRNNIDSSKNKYENMETTEGSEENKSKISVEVSDSKNSIVLLNDMQFSVKEQDEICEVDRPINTLSSSEVFEEENLKGKNHSPVVAQRGSSISFVRSAENQIITEDEFIKPQIIPSQINVTMESSALNENISLISEEEFKNINITRYLNETVLSESELPSDIISGEDKPSTTSRSSTRASSSYSRKKMLSGIGQLLKDLRSTESLVTGESMESDCSEFVTKRKTKRVRKRRKKNKVEIDTSANDSPIVAASNYVPKPVRSRACPSMHLKFEEDADKLRVIDVTKKDSDSKYEVESYVESSCVENVTIDSDVDENRSQNFNIGKEHILKSPSIKNLLPKVGDIIAFKVLRITDNYTPEVSDYIIGKVKEFNAETKDTVYEILNGLEQCQEPDGKLSLGLDESCNSKEKKFSWTDIIDPRLLFP